VIDIKIEKIITRHLKNRYKNMSTITNETRTYVNLFNIKYLRRYIKS
jgi:hypothetical protein